MESIINQSYTTANKTQNYKFMSNSKNYDWLGEDVEGKQPPFDAVNYKYMEPDRNYDNTLKPDSAVSYTHLTLPTILRV